MDNHFKRHPDVYSKPLNNSEYARDDEDSVMEFSLNDFNGKADFAGVLYPISHLQPFAPYCESLGDATDSTSYWPAAVDGPRIPNAFQSHDNMPRQTIAPSSSASVISTSPEIRRRQRSRDIHATNNADNRIPLLQEMVLNNVSGYSTVSASPAECDRTRRARYAANQRHRKAREESPDSHQKRTATEADNLTLKKKQRHREKNKVAAARCRSRQRKQVQTIVERGIRLGEANAKLKTMIKELRRELNDLRSLALDHQRCNCHVARYNHCQAQRVVAEYRKSCLTAGPEDFDPVLEQQVFHAQ